MNRQLPDRPSIEHLSGQARALLNDWQSGATDRVVEWFPTQPPILSRAQTVIAREYGFPSWNALRRHVLTFEFHDAIRHGRHEDVARMLRQSSWLASAPLNSTSPAHLAAEEDDVVVIDLLRRAGANLSATYAESAHTPLSWAITVNSFHAANYLADHSDPDLFCLAGLGRVDAVRSFWRDGDPVGPVSKTGSSRSDEGGNRLPCPPVDVRDQISDALYIAARSGRLEVCRSLLDHGADPNFRGYLGGTPLHWASYANAPDVSALLVEHGADETLIDDEFRAAPRAFGLIVLAAWGLDGMLRRRLERTPQDVDLCGGYGTALNAAVWNRSVAAVKVLLEFGADWRIPNASGLNARQLAIARGFEEFDGLFEDKHR